MDILQNFIIDGTDLQVNVHWENEIPFYLASEIGTMLAITQIGKALSLFDEEEKVEKIVANKTQVFLTEIGLYRLLMSSKNPIVHPFQKWLSKKITSIDTSIQNEAIECKNHIQKIKQATFIKQYEKKQVLIFGKINIDGNTCVTIICATDQLPQCANILMSEFGNIEIFKVIECTYCQRFERFVLNHAEISKYAYIDGSGDLQENLFVFDDAELEKAINIAQHNAFHFRNTIDLEKQLEIEKIKLETIIRVKDIIQCDPNSLNIDPILMFMDNRNFTPSKANKVQRYSPDGKQLLQTYESAIGALRDINLDSPNRTSIANAIKTSTVYKGFRWAFLERALPDDTIQELLETVQSQDIRQGFVAMLDLKQTKIVNVFKNQKDAGTDRHFKSTGPICLAIKNGTISGGHYFKMWTSCSDQHKTEYLSRGTLPEKHVSGGQRILQLHPVTRAVIKEYASITEVTQFFRFSRSALFNSIDNGFITKGYIWALGDIIA
jgi:prophage antirepressor-like protein